jgi:ABC-2 type transport system permease protein
MSELSLPRGVPAERAAAPAVAAMLTDAAVMAGRCLRMSRRQLDALLTSLMLPVMLMIVFVYLFGNAINTGTKYVTYVVPGVLLLCAAVGSATTAVAVAQDMTGGVIDRFRSMDIAAAPILAGHVVANVARNIVSTVLVFGAAFAIGFRPHADPAAWLGVAGILVLFLVAVSWLCAAYGLLTRSPESANSSTFLLMFVTYASSAFVPVRTMPGWLRGFAANQPATSVIETLRGLLLGTPVGPEAWRAVAWCLGIGIVSVALCGVLFRRRTA